MTKLHRNPGANPLGKCTGTRLDVPVPEVVEERVIATALMAGVSSKTEYARGIIERAMVGEFTLLMLKNNPAMGIDGAPEVSLDAAITTMATLNGMTPDEFRDHVLRRVLFGEFSMSQSLAEARAQGNQTNIG